MNIKNLIADHEHLAAKARREAAEARAAGMPGLASQRMATAREHEGMAEILKGNK